MELTFLGTCSGTEPIEGYRHVSFTLTTGGGVYFFDAGGSCAYTAHVMGIDLLAVRAVFITHAHMDHFGGLPELLGTMFKLIGMAETPDHAMAGRTLEVLIPNLDPWQGALRMLGVTESDPNLPFALNAHTYADGPVFDDGAVGVAALHNEHLGAPTPPDPWRSFSFRIEAEDKAIVYSGDVRHVSELAPLAEAGCDLLLMETGHHLIPEVCEHLRDAAWPIGQTAFIHHGRATLADPEGEGRKGSEVLGQEVLVLRDRQTMSL